MNEAVKQSDTKPQQVFLNLGDRLAFCSLLPKQGTYVSLTEYSEARAAVHPTAEDFAKMGVKDNGDGTITAANVDRARELRPFTITSFVHKTIRDRLARDDADGKLEDHHRSLYDQFVGGKYPEMPDSSTPTNHKPTKGKKNAATN